MDELDGWPRIGQRLGVKPPLEELPIETFPTFPRLAARIAPTVPEVA